MTQETRTVVIRPVETSDLPAILDIMNAEIRDGHAHFGTEPMTLGELEAEFQSADKYPWTAAIDEGRVLGFAKANPWKSRGGYSRTCEVGIYVRPDCQGRGLGKRIYEAIIPELKARGFKTLLGGIAQPNPASIRLHEACGFRHVGTLPSVGWKQGAWRDVGYWALTFDDAE